MIFAYVIAFFLAPTVGIGLGFILYYILAYLRYLFKIPAPLLRVIVSIIMGFVTIWTARFIFAWFNVHLTLLMVIILGLEFVFYDFREIIRISSWSEMRQIKIAGAFGDLLGIIIGGIYFL